MPVLIGAGHDSGTNWILICSALRQPPSVAVWPVIQPLMQTSHSLSRAGRKASQEIHDSCMQSLPVSRISCRGREMLQGSD